MIIRLTPDSNMERLTLVKRDSLGKHDKEVSRKPSDQLKLAGIQNPQFFKQIYDREFIQLSRPDSIKENSVPFLMFQGVIVAYGRYLWFLFIL